MISTSRLRAGLVGDYVVFDKHGDLVDMEIPADIGPAGFLVSPVTDAVKQLEGGTVRSLDRDRLWSVDAIVLNRVVLRRMEDQELTAEELLTTVRELGYTWQVSPISAP